MEDGQIYITADCDPYVNMAMDEWLFASLSDDFSKTKAILRLYTWGAPAITIGYNQSLSKAIDLDRLDENLPVIRRITGGRAIYHDRSEITFSLCLNLDLLHRSEQSISKTSLLVSRTLIEIFDRAGISAKMAKRSDPDLNKSGPDKTAQPCFKSRAKFEIIMGDSKIAAGAQRKIGNYLIHQGSLKVGGLSECAAIGQVAVPVKKATGRGELIRGKMTLLGFAPHFEDCFSQNLGVAFTQCELKNEGRGGGSSRVDVSMEVDFNNYTADFIKKSLDRRQF